MGTQRGPSLLPSWRWLAMTFVLTSLAMTSSRAARLQRCERPPRFAVNSVEPMTLTNGHVTLVALLTNTCPFCISQSRRLQTLHEELQGNNSDVRMMIIDAGPTTSRVFESIVSFDVYRDDSQQQIWRQVFKGSKDDILIFNRCGMLTYHLSFPYSYLGYSYVRRALSNTENNPNICSACAIHSDPHDRMMGDAPMPSLHRQGHNLAQGHHHRSGHNLAQGHHGGIMRNPTGRERHPFLSNQSKNRSRCPKGDTLCRELRRGRRRYNRFRSAHGIGRHSLDNNEEQILQMLARDGLMPRVSPTL